MAEFQRTLGRQERQLSRQNSEMSAVGNNMSSTRSLPRRNNIEIGQITEHVQRVIPDNRSTSRAINRSYYKINFTSEMSLFTCTIDVFRAQDLSLSLELQAEREPVLRRLCVTPLGFCLRVIVKEKYMNFDRRHLVSYLLFQLIYDTYAMLIGKYDGK